MPVAASLGTLEFAVGEALACCDAFDCSLLGFVSVARVCTPLLAVRAPGGSAGFLVWAAAGGFGSPFASAAFLSFCGEFGPAGCVREPSAALADGNDFSFANDGFAFVLSFAASAVASGLAGVGSCEDDDAAWLALSGAVAFGGLWLFWAAEGDDWLAALVAASALAGAAGAEADPGGCFGVLSLLMSRAARAGCCFAPLPLAGGREAIRGGSVPRSSRTRIS